MDKHHAMVEFFRPKIEELSTKWDTKISKVNAEYDKFAKEHTK